MENNYIFRFIPVYIESGSTLLGQLDLGFGVSIMKRIRLVNIKCHSTNVPAGAASKKFVEELMHGRDVFCKTFKDKFKKWSAVLAVVYIKNGSDLINLNDELMKKEHAFSVRNGQDKNNENVE